MCKNLVEKGNLSSPLIIFNRTEKRATDLRDSFPAGKILVLETIDAVISASDIIFTCVSNDAAIEGIISSALQTGHSLKHKLFVDCSTVHPKTTRALANMIKEVDAEFVASPLLGVPAMAHAGQLVCILAGASSSLERVKPYTKGVMSRMDIVFSGVDPAMATLLKIVANTLVLSMVEALAEGHTLAEKSGLGTGNLEKAIEVVFPGLYMAYSKLLSSGDYYKKDEVLLNLPDSCRIRLLRNLTDIGFSYSPSSPLSWRVKTRVMR